MAYSNNHYVPQFIQRRFGNKISRFNVETGEIKQAGSIKNAFAEKDIYPLWLEKMFSDLEAKMAELLDEKVLTAEGTVTLTRADNWLIKKFFVIEMLRVPGSSTQQRKYSEPVEALKQQGFKEVAVENESIQDYAFRTMKAIMESKSIEHLFQHPEVTYEACKWGAMFHHCYVTIWDSKMAREDFVITDNGMNCEHDKTRFRTMMIDGETVHNEKEEMLKAGYMAIKMEENKDRPEALSMYAGLLMHMCYVHANYYLFAVSNTRTIALINPFYRMYDDPNFLAVAKDVPDVWPTTLCREAMRCNTQTYQNSSLNPTDEDLFHYQIVDLPLEDVIAVNNMMLDRVYRWLGYVEGFKIVRSLNVYSMIHKDFQRKNYDKLIQHLSQLGYDFPKTQKYAAIRDKLTVPPFTERERECIRFVYRLSKKVQNP